MKFVIQRVQSASVTVDEKIVGKIEKGYLVLIGIAQTDTKEIADKMMRKLINLRIFEDAEGKTNLDICKKEIPVVEHGIFGADMKVSLLNDGPFTIVLDSAEIL